MDCTVWNEHHRTYVVFFYLNNFGFSMAYACGRLILVSVWGTYWHTYVPGTSERFLAICGVAQPGHTTTARLCVTTAASEREGLLAVSSTEYLRPVKQRVYLLSHRESRS